MMSDQLTFMLFLLGPPVAGELMFLLVLLRSDWWRRSKAGRSRLALLNLLSCIIMLTLSFGGGELYYRYLYDTTESMALTRVTQRWLERYWVNNSIGVRDNVEYYPNVRPGMRRVSFLGDSFTAGQGIKNVEDRFPNIIRREQPGWEIHVLAQLGLDTGTELPPLKELAEAGYQFDRIVLVYCLNDVSELLAASKGRIDCKALQWKEGGWLRRHSYFADLLYYRLQAARNPLVRGYFDYVSSGYQGAIWQEQQKRLLAIHDLVKAQGGKLLVVTFPFLHAVGANYPFQPAHQALDSFWQRLGVPHLDLLPVYSNLSPEKVTVNRFDAHPNEFANALAARAIEEFLKTNLSAKVSTPD